VSASTSIEWTRSDDGSAGSTWNPVTGCTKVSEGCDHCYAETFAERWRGVPGHPFEQGFDVRLWPERLTLPLQWRRPRRVFLNRMSDLWHEAVGADLIAHVFAVIAVAEQHTFQVLTKRPGRMHSLLGDDAFWDQVGTAAGLYDPSAEAMAAIEGRILPNLWLGVSVETQKWVPVRLGKLAPTERGASGWAGLNGDGLSRHNLTQIEMSWSVVFWLLGGSEACSVGVAAAAAGAPAWAAARVRAG
jgi:protein gp37